MSLLEVTNLRISTRRGVPLVKGIDFALAQGEWFALIGESGSGKSITSSSITNLQATSLKREADAIDFDSLDLLGMSKQQLRKARGEQIAYVFQDYQSAFTPYYTIGNQLHETLKAHRGMPFGARAAKIEASRPKSPDAG